MNSKQLECFICVADRMNFTKAAEELFLSTPTVTHHIKTLEEELETKLFVRTSKSVRFTEEGRIFYGDVKDILNKMNVAKKKLKKRVAEDISFLKIGCTSFAELEKMENVLSVMKNKFPQVYPQVFVRDYINLKKMFVNGHIDVMLVSKDMVNDIDCKFKKLKHLKSYALMSHEIELPQKEKLKFEDIAYSYPIITLNPKFIPFKPGDPFQEKMALYSQNNYIIVSESDRGSILFAKSGYGIAILPDNCIPTEHQGLVIKELDEDINIEYGIATREEIKEEHIKFFINYFSLI